MSVLNSPSPWLSAASPQGPRGSTVRVTAVLPQSTGLLSKVPLAVCWGPCHQDAAQLPQSMRGYPAIVFGPLEGQSTARPAPHLPSPDGNCVGLPRPRGPHCKSHPNSPSPASEVLAVRSPCTGSLSTGCPLVLSPVHQESQPGCTLPQVPCPPLHTSSSSSLSTRKS